jgi:hypothetical protein
VEKDNDVPSHNQISVRNLDSHDGVRKRDEYARGGADASEYRPQPAAVRNDARDTPRRTSNFRARRTRFTSCQTEQSIWMDQARRHGRALGDTRTPMRLPMAPSNESTPSEVEAALHPQVRASLVLACLRFLLPTAKAAGVTDKTLFAPADANLNNTVSLRRSAMPDDG